MFFDHTWNAADASVLWVEITTIHALKLGRSRTTENALLLERPSYAAGPK